MTNKEAKCEFSLRTKYKRLEDEVSVLKLKISLLKEESLVQAKLISQLKLLHISTLKLNSRTFCDAGHFRCRIDHKRFNFTNMKVDQDLEPSKPLDQSVSLLQKSLLLPKNDEIFLRRLSKNIDILQAKYGLPSSLRDKILIASADSIFIEPVHSERATTKKTMVFRYKHVPLVMYDRKPRKFKQVTPVKVKDADKHLFKKEESLDTNGKESEDDTDASGDAGSVYDSDADLSCSCSDDSGVAPAVIDGNNCKSDSEANREETNGTEFYMYDDYEDLELYDEEEAYAREAYLDALFQASQHCIDDGQCVDVNSDSCYIDGNAFDAQVYYGQAGDGYLEDNGNYEDAADYDDDGYDYGHGDDELDVGCQDDGHIDDEYVDDGQCDGNYDEFSEED